MTSDEIKAAIERLRRPDSINFITDLLGYDRWSSTTARELLIDLLQQADPDTHMELPVDDYGEAIHQNDIMELANGKRVEVAGVSRGGFFYYDEEVIWTDVGYKRHYHKPTVEDVLRKMLDAVADGSVSYDDATYEYAKLLRLKEENE